MDAVGRVSPFTRSYLLEAHPVSFTNQLLTIGFDPQFADHLELVDNPKNRTLIQTKLKELGYPNAQAKLIKAQAPGPAEAPPLRPPPSDSAPPTATPPRDPITTTTTTTTALTQAIPQPVPRPSKAQPPTALDKNDFKNDPLIQKALEIFKAQIVEVRAD
jgi:hypothetical protein